MSPPILDPIRGALLRSQPDGRLVVLAREGRERALEEIVRRYRAPLVAFAAMIVPAHRADDVVQESLLRAFDSLRSSDAEIQLRPWLFRIVRNQALNALRDTPVHDELTEELDGVSSPEQIAERREEIAAIVGGLQALPDEQREAIVARELEGRGHAEIAAELGTSPGAVRQLIFRARTTLRGAAGLLLPLPLLRLLLGPGGAEAAGAATAGVAAATAGGGAATGVAGKVAVGLAGVALAVGGGVAAERNRDDAGDRIASASESGDERGDSGAPGPSEGGHGGAHVSGDGGGPGPGTSNGSGPGHGDSGHGGGDRSGPSGRGGADDSGGSGTSGSGDSGSSGSGGSGHSGGPGSDSSGPGSGDDDFAAEAPEIDDDSISSGSSGSGSSGSGISGSGSSGSDSSGSGSSGSGSSGSDSSGSDSSGSGSSGSGSSGSDDRDDVELD